MSKVKTKIAQSTYTKKYVVTHNNHVEIIKAHDIFACMLDLYNRGIKLDDSIKIECKA